MDTVSISEINNHDKPLAYLPIPKPAENEAGLGSITNTASISVITPSKPLYKTPQKIQEKHDEQAQQVRQHRYRRQHVVSQILTGDKWKRVRQCMHKTAPIWDSELGYLGVHENVDIHKSKATGRVSARNLMLCDSVWVCPVCSARISEERRNELDLVVKNSDYFPVLITFTQRHKYGEPLQKTFNALADSLREFKSGRWWQNFKFEYEFVGDIKAIEITYGSNGAHAHSHHLMWFCRKPDIGQIEALFKSHWLKILRKNGGDADYEHGVKVSKSHRNIANYVSKYGNQGTWGLPEEMTKSQQKVAKKGGSTIWDLIDQYDDTGDPRLAALIREYAEVTWGRSQLVWSAGLKELLNLEKLLQEHAEPEPEMEHVLSVTRHEWVALYWSRKRGKFLNLVEDDDIVGAMRLLNLSVERYQFSRGSPSPYSWTSYG